MLGYSRLRAYGTSLTPSLSPTPQTASTGVLLPRMSFAEVRLWRTPVHFWCITESGGTPGWFTSNSKPQTTDIC